MDLPIMFQKDEQERLRGVLSPCQATDSSPAKEDESYVLSHVVVFSNQPILLPDTHTSTPSYGLSLNAVLDPCQAKAVY